VVEEGDQPTQLPFKLGFILPVRIYGFEEMSPIQQRVIPSLIQGRDLIVESSSGTGKTAAFLIPLLQKINLKRLKRKPQALIIAPSRELASQITKVCENLGEFLDGLCVHCLCGGDSVHRAIRTLQRGGANRRRHLWAGF